VKHFYVLRIFETAFRFSGYNDASKAIPGPSGTRQWRNIL